MDNPTAEQNVRVFTDPEKRFLTVKEAADYLQFNKNMIYRHCQQGRIPAVKVGDSWRISSDFFERLEEREKNGN